jgi:DNA-binding NarL/FixJ family response regulator
MVQTQSNPWVRSAAAGVTVGPDDKRTKTPQTAEVFPERDTEPVHVSLFCPPCAFAETIARALCKIEPRCRIRQSVALDSGLHSGPQSALALIDLDAAADDAGPALVEALALRHPRTPIVALSDCLDRKSIERALEAGAAGYLPKTYSEPLVEGVLRLVIGGKGYRPESTRPAPARCGRPRKQAANGERSAAHEYGLTDRETEVLAQIARGCSNLEIGKRLGAKETTVKRHVYNIFGKLNVQNRAEAALMGARLGEVQREQMREAQSGRLNLGWLQSEMSHRRMRKGQTIFRLGDVGNALYYLQRGAVCLPEIGATVQPGEVFGEIGIFTPEHRRTCSAVCETDSELFSLSSEQVKRIHFTNPQFAFFILHLIATRLMADRKRGN